MTTLRHLRLIGLGLMVSLTLPPLTMAQTTYQKPPQEVLDILDAPVTPDVSLSPTRDTLLLIDRVRYPAIAELAQPMLPLAGIRINPANHGPYRAPQSIGLTLQPVATGKQTRLSLPVGARIGSLAWAPDGKHFAFALYWPDRIELWSADAETAKAQLVKGVILNGTMGVPIQWMPDGKKLLCRTVAPGQGQPPSPPTAPAGPNIQESFGKSAPARTHQDLLRTTYDDALFEYYFTCQLVLVDPISGKTTNVAKPGLYTTADPAPGSPYLLVASLKKPFSRLLPVSGFAREIAVWDLQGSPVFKLADLPSHEGVPIEGVMTGPRNVHWRPTADATLVWAEALDGGDPKTKVPHRDKLMALSAPFKTPAKELLRLEQRFSGLSWGERLGMALVSDYDRDRRWVRTFLARFDLLDAPLRIVWERSVRDRYRDRGDTLMRSLRNGERAIWQTDDFIYLSGEGASPKGDYPFLDKFNLRTLAFERVFQSSPGEYESVVALVSDRNGLKFITRHETPSQPPNYRLRTAAKPEAVSLTRFPDPTPQLRKITKQLVTYKRADGVPLSFTLYLPADYKPGTPLPTVLWAYPLEFNDPDTAGQISGSTNRFTTFAGSSHLFFLTQGYAILDNATMPIVGLPETMNDTFIDQVVDSARAAVEKAVAMGVTDSRRVGVGGHSYGAFMTANLLAHSRLFRAGLARSGAYNRTLTPFGFQGERRTYWEAPNTYNRLSPFMHADKIKDPILLIHGEADDNDGTFPVQSQRLFQAIKGNGGSVRYVTLPFEAHGYAARESIEHVLYEMLHWFDTYVKHAKPALAETAPIN